MDKLILPAIHLFALVGFIIYKTKTPFVGFVSNRHAQVKDGLNRAKIQAAEAGAKKREIEAKFAGLQKEKDSIFAEWKEKEQAQINAIKAAAPKILAQMKTDAEMNRKSLEEQMRAQIMKKVAEEVLTQVEQKVKDGLTSEKHASLNEQFSKEVLA